MDEMDALSDYSAASRVSADDLDELLCPLGSTIPAPASADTTAQRKPSAATRSATNLAKDPKNFDARLSRKSRTEHPLRRQKHNHQPDHNSPSASSSPPPLQQKHGPQRVPTRPPPLPRTKNPHIRVASVGDATVSSMSSSEDPASTDEQRCGKRDDDYTIDPSSTRPQDDDRPKTSAGDAFHPEDNADGEDDAFAGLGVVKLRDEDEIEFGEGITMREDEEEQQINMGRDMFARSRNVAMIWGSLPATATLTTTTTITTVTTTTTAAVGSADDAETPWALKLVDESAADATRQADTGTGADAKSAVTSTSTPPGSFKSASPPASPARSASPSVTSLPSVSLPFSAVYRAVSILLSQHGAHTESYAAAMCNLAARSVGASQEAWRSAAVVAGSVHRRGKSAPPRPLPPAPPSSSDARWGPRPLFAAALPLAPAAALVTALFATAGEIFVRRFTPGVLELRIDDSDSRLSIALDLRERVDELTDLVSVDVRIRRAPRGALAVLFSQGRKEQRARYERVLGEAETRWNSLGFPAKPKDHDGRDTTKAALSAMRILATRGSIGFQHRQTINDGGCRRHTMGI